MSKSISFHQDHVYSRGHNIRDPRFVKNQEHILHDLTPNNVTLIDIPVKQAYQEIFGKANDEYNASQKRKDRKTPDYYEHVKQDKQLHTVYECIVQIGDHKDTGNSAEAEKAALIRYVETWPERNPALKLIGAYIHCDEPNGTVHLHIDFIPVAHYTKGRKVRNSLSQALAEQGHHFAPGKGKKRYSEAQWQDSERRVIADICQELGIDAKLPDGSTTERGHLTTQEYKKLAQQAEADILADVHEKKTAVENELADISEQTAEAKNMLEELTKKKSASEQELADIESQIQLAQSERDTAKAEAAAFAEQAADAKNELACLAVEKASADQLLSETTNMVFDARTELEDIQQQRVNAMEATKTALADKHAAEKHIRELTDTIASKEEQSAQANKVLSNNRDFISLLSNSKKMLTSEIGSTYIESYLPEPETTGILKRMESAESYRNRVLPLVRALLNKAIALWNEVMRLRPLQRDAFNFRRLVRAFGKSHINGMLEEADRRNVGTNISLDRPSVLEELKRLKQQRDDQDRDYVRKYHRSTDIDR